MMLTTNHIEHAGVPGLYGSRLGYVCEAVVVPGVKGAADYYVAWLHLVIQVDGEGHDDTEQRKTDRKYAEACKKHNVNLLRLYYDDEKFFGVHIERAFRWCFAHGKSKCLHAGSRQHPLVKEGVLIEAPSNV